MNEESRVYETANSIQAYSYAGCAGCWLLVLIMAYDGLLNRIYQYQCEAKPHSKMWQNVDLIEIKKEKWRKLAGEEESNGKKYGWAQNEQQLFR